MSLEEGRSLGTRRPQTGVCDLVVVSRRTFRTPKVEITKDIYEFKYAVDVHFEEAIGNRLLHYTMYFC